MYKFRSIAITTFSFICMVSYAQDTWTLNNCVTYALDHNLKLHDLKLNTASSKEGYQQSYRELFPSISAGSNYDISYGRSVDPNNNQIVSSNFYSNNYSINANIDIFRGFQKLNTIASTKFLYKATQEESLQEKYLLAFRVMTAFYDVKFYQGQLQITSEQLEISSTNVNLVKRQIELGLKAGADLYEAESVESGDKLAVIQSKNNLKAAKLKLLQEMNLNEQNDIEITTLDESIALDTSYEKHISTDSIYTNALTFMPTIRSQEFRVNAAKREMAIARGSLYPSLSFSAGYGTGYFETNVDALGKVIPFRTQISDNASQFIGLSLRIPISQGWSKRSEVKQQKIALLRAENNLSLQKQELNKIIQELIQNYQSTLAEHEQTEQSVTMHALAFKISQKKYDRGMISLLELNQSKNLYAKAQNDNLQVTLKLKVQKKTVDFYKGLPVFNIN
ncbi:TolC family protein [Yeosuana sp.]|uniref:TolC family protein n=1 Tax=Yeosuana sp. TaxID=2529388 RepID=UPI00405521D1